MDQFTTSLYGFWASITGCLLLADMGRYSPTVSVLIAIGVAHVILKVAYRFETVELEELSN
tara:strand:- start:181 stop:363 length:183 start_codon:yes stop_codon:yes gene_type:complete